MMAPELDLASFREDQVPRASATYLDYARRGLLLHSAHDALLEAIASLQEGSSELAQQARIRESARTLMAKLVGVLPQQLAFTSNTTTAIALLAQSVPWTSGDRVLLAPDEVASNRLPWRALEGRGVKIDQLPSRGGRLDLLDLQRACRDEPPHWFSLSYVSLESGQLRPVQEATEIVQAAGGRVCVDVAQALGVLRIDEALKRVDAVVGCGRKWLCGPPGVGFLALPRSDGLIPVSAGMRSLDGEEWLPGALAWEGGVEPVLALAGLEACLRARERVSDDEVEAAALRNAKTLRSLLPDQVAAMPAGEVSPVVWVETKRAVTPAQLQSDQLAARPQGHRVRLSPHAWSTTGELERAAFVLRGL